ncbi:hypothetical protein BFX31_17395 [Vibrio paracholerae]|nr:hypothetical protein BFX31_17395 [Vibrio paracholerae]
MSENEREIEQINQKNKADSVQKQSLFNAATPLLLCRCLCFGEGVASRYSLIQQENGNSLYDECMARVHQ